MCSKWRSLSLDLQQQLQLMTYIMEINMERNQICATNNLSEKSLSVWSGDEIFCSVNLLMWEGKLLYVAVVW